MADKKQGGVRGRIGGLLFGGIFASIGIGFLFFSILPTLLEAWEMRSWQPVEAEVLSSDLRRNSSSDGTTYRATGRYRYSWHGRDYVGGRIGISSGSDNIGDWQQQVARRLDNARSYERPLTVWVNPAAPHEAVVDREVRWGLFAFKMLFVMLFGGVGTAIMIYTVRKRPKLDPTSPTPWLGNPAWRENRISSGGKAVIWALWIFGLVWMAFMYPLLDNADKLTREGLPLSLFPYILPLIGLLILAQAVVKTLRRQRFGGAVLSLHPFPGEVGGRVAGQVEVKLDHRNRANVEVRLSCVHVYWRRSGSKNERREEIIWQDTRNVKPRPGPRGGVIEFDFRPPAGLPVSSDGSNYHKWVVNVYAKVSGPDLEHRFTIPVFDQHSDSSSAVERSAPAVSPPPPAFDEQHLPRWLKQSWSQGGLELRLPMLRNPTLGFVLLLMGVIFGGVGGFLLQEGEAPFLFALIFAMVGGGLFLGGIYSLGNSLQVHVSPRGVARIRRLFGVPFSKTIPATEIRKLQASIGMRSNNRAFYRVHAVTAGGKQITLADTLPSASAADHLVEKLSQQLQLKTEEGEHGYTSGMTRPGQTPLASPEMFEKVRKLHRWIRVIFFVVFLLIFASVVLNIFLQ